MPFDRSRVVPLVCGHELRRDFSELVADAVPAEHPDAVRRTWAAYRAPYLDFLWCGDDACDGFPEALEDLAGGAHRLLAIARSALIDVAREIPSDDRLGRAVRRLLADEGLRGRDLLIVAFDDGALPYVGLLGGRALVEHVVGRCRGLADETVPVLVTGETGTGKEVIARALHRLGRRRSKTWLALNCAELPESILESELFGHLRGAFTGAAMDRAGLFEAAGDGTVFLDEIGELPSGAQAKLLRVLEEHRVRRLGSASPRPLHCRVVAATNRVLAREITRGTFRADLFYRLRGAEIPLPPLRERRSDVVPLAQLFATRAALRFRRPAIGLSDDAKLALLSHEWPGNVRELRQTIEAAVLQCNDACIRASALSILPAPAAAAGSTTLLTVRALERAHIVRALETTSGNKGAAARLLGLTRQSLQRRLRRHGLALANEGGLRQPEPDAGNGHALVTDTEESQ
ncbi:MAG: two-component system, NtrC family, response regulator HydG [Candidatus Binatota bacterium]|jgi:DNA-binding NtrC family response regulator|nr:two-component system, NtrC family, response regulator HydG [Candidatus Binatota bacterium]